MDTSEQIKIWQHMRSDSQSVTEGLSALAAGALTEAATFGALAGRTQGPPRKILLQLQEEELCHARTLKGFFQILTGTPMNITAIPPSQDKMDVALRKCYGKALKALRAYESRLSQGESGAIFACLAAKKREHCCKIAELMGLLGV